MMRVGKRGTLLLVVLLLSGTMMVMLALREHPKTLPTLQRMMGGRPAPKTFYDRLAYAAEDIVDPEVVYDPSYVQIPYPGGDVPAKRGVCADVVIRAYRKLGIDLQVLVHEDMRAHFNVYPHKWGLRRPDPNIDHRRVYNLATFFKRHGETLPITQHGDDYRPGDLVTWDVQTLAHIGIVSSIRTPENNRFMIVHNIGQGQVLEDILFAFPITGHYRYQR